MDATAGSSIRTWRLSVESYGEVKRSGMLEGRMQLEKSLMLWKSSVNTYQIPDEVHDWFTRGQGNWGVLI